jgi:hypothetical protein
VRNDDVSAAEVGLDVVAGVAACNQSIEVVTEEVLDGVSAPAHVVTTEPSSVVIVEVPVVILILITDLKRVL